VLKKLGYNEAKTKWISAILLGEYRAREIAEALSMDVTNVYETIKDTKKRLKRSTLLKQIYE
jgi:sugar-specific transcriptional regulator TrmB